MCCGPNNFYYWIIVIQLSSERLLLSRDLETLKARSRGPEPSNLTNCEITGITPAPGQASVATSSACNPFGPCFTRNETLAPSLSVRYPVFWIAVKWTNTSSPFSR